MSSRGFAAVALEPKDRWMGPGRDDHDPRIAAAFRVWLASLATDPDAVTAASMAYESLAGEGRDAWLDALDTEAASLSPKVPALALYAPLMGVEADPVRRGRIDAAVRASPAASHPTRPLRALRGVHPSGDVVVAVAIPLYLDFVEILVCRYQPDHGVTSALRGPLVQAADLFGGAASTSPRLEVDSVLLDEEVPIGVVVEELAHAVVADRRAGRPPPPPLLAYDFLFIPDLAVP